ncbi:MAG: conjugal transfer protein TraF [Gammaproteobacteria bacterium]
MSNKLWICLIFPGLAFANFFEERERGWFWYERQKGEKNEPIKQTNLDSKPSYTHQMQQIRERIDESLNRAILEPTDSNLVEFLKEYQKAANKAEKFSDLYQLAILKNPKIFPLQYSSNNSMSLQERNHKEILRKTLYKLSKTHGFFFVFSSTCSYCHSSAPVVKNFSKEYDLTVMGISVDGGTVREFPDAIHNKSLLIRLGLNSVPVLLAYNARTQEILPLTNGEISIQNLEHSVYLYAAKELGSLN